jgi:hypothetical protein
MISPRVRNRDYGIILSFLHQSGFDRLHGNEHPFGATIGQFNADALKVGTKLARCDTRHVRADTAAFLALSLTIDGATYGGGAYQ